MLDGVIDRTCLEPLRTGRDSFATVNRRQRLTLRLRQARVPFLAKTFPAERGALFLAGFGPEFRLAAGIGDPLLFGHLLNQRRAPREAFQHIRRYPGNLEIIAFTIDAKAEFLEPPGEANPKGRLEVRGVPFQFAELAGLPAALLVVPGRVEYKNMGVQLGVRQTINGPRRGMDEFGPDHVARRAVRVLQAPADAGLHLRFHVTHRLIDGCPECRQDVLVAAHGVKQRDRLRHREREVVTHCPLASRSHGQRLAGPWVTVVAQPIERGLIHRPFQPEPGRTLTAPQADQFLSLAVIVCCSVVTFRVLGVILLGDTNHPPILDYHKFLNEILTKLCSPYSTSLCWS